MKRDVSSAKSLAFDFKPSGKSFMKIRKRSGPRIDPCGTPARIGLHVEVWPFKTTLWSLPES